MRSCGTQSRQPVEDREGNRLRLRPGLANRTDTRRTAVIAQAARDERSRPGRQLIAKWTARGDTLVFTTASGTQVRAEILDCAVSITCEFLDQTKARRN